VLNKLEHSLVVAYKTASSFPNRKEQLEIPFVFLSGGRDSSATLAYTDVDKHPIFEAL
jgi:hypothetical protein